MIFFIHMSRYLTFQCLLVNIWYYVIYWFNNFHVSMNKRNLIIVTNSFIVSNWNMHTTNNNKSWKNQYSHLFALSFQFKMRWTILFYTQFQITKALWYFTIQNFIIIIFIKSIIWKIWNVMEALNFQPMLPSWKSDSSNWYIR